MKIRDRIFKLERNEIEIDKCFVAITAQDIEIIRLLGQGYILKEIAAQLRLNVRTVESHTHKIKKIFNAKSLIHVVYLCAKNNII